MSGFYDEDYGIREGDDPMDELDRDQHDFPDDAESCLDVRSEHYAGRDYDSAMDECPIDGVGFADPGGNSALRAETRNNPRNLPCPDCGRKNMLTPIDKQRGYCCDRCANRKEMGMDF